MGRHQQGFTLIEIAIVLVIIGLLLGGVLKGQELITGARVRNIIQQQDGIKAAYFGFLDRYRALPGDYRDATNTIQGVSTAAGCGVAGTLGNGNGDGQITAANNEYILAWDHLSKAQFINGSYTCAAPANAPPGAGSYGTAATSPANPYGQFLGLIYDNVYASGPAAQVRHNLKTGGSIPSDILGEIDRKVDDGNALTGSFRGQTLGPGIGAVNLCYNGPWISTPGGTECGGVTVF
jgi:prepilin-type N-terminal cleavage/methylation domain-containing protein